jgi:hypothetical protein
MPFSLNTTFLMFPCSFKIKAACIWIDYWILLMLLFSDPETSAFVTALTFIFHERYSSLCDLKLLPIQAIVFIVCEDYNELLIT